MGSASMATGMTTSRRAVGPAAGVDFVAVDLRGHGRSPGRRGVVQHYDELTADLTAAFEWTGRERPGLPRFVLGHSNGGQVALRAALDPRVGPAIDGLILSNPSLRLSVQVPGYKLRLGRFLLRRAPLDHARRPAQYREAHQRPRHAEAPSRRPSQP